MKKKDKERLRNKMKNIVKIILVFLGLFIFTNNLIASQETDIREAFRAKLDKVLDVVQHKELSKDDRNSKIIELLTPMFDFKLMAKLSLGKKAWMSLDKMTQDKFVELYVNRMKKSYSEKLDGYKDQKIEILSVTQKKNRISIKTEVIDKHESLKVEYKYYKPKKQKENKDKWLIYDVEIIGVSILKADKAQFKEFLKTKTITQLMDELVKQ